MAAFGIKNRLAAAAELALKRKLSFPAIQDETAVGEAVEQGGGHFGITKDRGPFAEVEVGGDRHAGALVELALLISVET